MSCKCSNCRRDSILNGSFNYDCDCCHDKLGATMPFKVINDNELVCEKCFSANYIDCPKCGKSHNKKESVEVSVSMPNGTLEKQLICKLCINTYYRKCKDCDVFVDRHHIKNYHDTFLCIPCFDKKYQSCGICLETFTRNTLNHISMGKKCCNNCYSFYGPIVTYNNKPHLDFHGKPPHFLGVELEVEIESGQKQLRGAAAQTIVDLLGGQWIGEGEFKEYHPFAITKEDGSLTCGFEICSQPATLTEHLKRWDKVFDKLPSDLASYNTVNCGLHVHASKSPLQLLTIAKVVVFINNAKNQSFIETIAGRKANKYCVISQKSYGIVKVPARERREAVNLTNRDTIEFRIFKGTLKRESFYKAIEFCDAVVQFCMTCTHSIAYCREKQNFIDYVGLRSKDYPHLYAFICAKFLKKETKLTKKFGFVVNTENNQDNENQK